MLHSLKTAIYITKTKVKVARIDENKKFSKEEHEEFEWSEQSLGQILQDIKTTYGEFVYITICPELTYVVAISIPAQLVDRVFIQQKAQEYISEDLNSIPWDFKEILEIEKPGIGIEKVIQIAALPLEFSLLLTKKVQEAGLHVAALEPLSYTLAYQIRNRVDPIILAHNDGETTSLIVIHRGLVVSSLSIHKDLEKTDIELLLGWVKKRFNIVPSTLLHSHTTVNISIEELAQYSLKVEEKQIDEMIGILMLGDVRGSDKKVLNVELPTSHTVEREQISQTRSEPNESVGVYDQLIHNQNKKRSFPMIFIAAFVVVSMSLLYGVSLFISNTSTQLRSQETTITIFPTTPQNTTSTSKEIPNIEEYSVVVLNGSGIPGEAKRIAELLSSQNFTVKEFRNADTSNYVTTEIQVSHTLDQEYVDDLATLLKETFTEVTIKTVQSSDSAEIIVVLGKNKKE